MIRFLYILAKHGINPFSKIDVRTAQNEVVSLVDPNTLFTVADVAGKSARSSIDAPNTVKIRPFNEIFVNLLFFFFAI